MCGICGFVGENFLFSDEMLEQMNNALIRRGPDESGAYRSAGIGMAMRRLSIIDIKGGRQPISNEDGTVWVVFNGEIYNYRELRSMLQQRGHQFRTNTDTEVLVHLYEEYGDDFINYLRGMFAFCIWDSNRGRALIARDRLGIKPLFYAQTDGALFFGSEIKALLASGQVQREIDYQALDAYITFTYIPAPLTIYQSIRKLEPGHMLVCESGSVEDKCYWDIDFKQVDQGTDEPKWLEKFDSAIDDAVESHLVSDVPVGAFLSGGVDSSLVVSLMSQTLKDDVQTFTMGFGGERSPLLDERPLAAKVAERYGCKYHEYTVQPNFRAIVGDIVGAFDEPFADDSVIPSYYVSQLTRKKVKVALSGLGGDELFAGYERYSGVLLSQYYSRFMPEILHRNIINPLIQKLPEPAHGGDRVNHLKRFSAAVMESPAERYLGFVSTISECERRELFQPAIAEKIVFEETGRMITDRYNYCDAPDDLSKALYVDLKTYLPEDILALSDRLSMWHSLEVRVPLVDHKLVELSARLPTGYKIDLRRKKILLKKLSSQRLPAEVLSQRKQGFESPMAAWLRTDLADYAREILGSDRLGATGIFNINYVSDKLEDHLTGRQKNNKLLFSLIMFQEWYERQVA